MQVAPALVRLTAPALLAFFAAAQDVQPTAAGRVAPDASRFQAVAAARLGAPAASIEIDRVEGPIVLADLGLEVFVAAARLADGEKTVVALRADGLPVDLGAVRAADRELARQRRGKMTLRLSEELRSRAASERHLVCVWLEAPAVETARADHAVLVDELDRAGFLTREEAEFQASELDRAVRAIVEPVTRGFADRLRGLGLEVEGADGIAPVVFVRADLQGLARLAEISEVASIDWAGQEYVERLNVASSEVRAPSVHFAAGGVTGAGAKVAIVEGGRACPSNPALTIVATRVAGGSISTHTTGVASCVDKIAPNVQIVSANAADFTSNTTNVTTQMPGSVAAVSWAVGQGAQIMNLSYGAGAPGSTVSSFDKYLDYVARNNAKTIAIACGNSGAFAGDPGAGFNTLAVGAFHDNNSSLWSGETMGAFSSWQNPSTGLETPQVAAPGVSLDMGTCTNGYSGYGASGTSFSSPITAGIAALCVSKNASLGSWPEAIRAIVMATAWHNIEGATRLSSKDGAGGVDALAAFRVVARGRDVGFDYGTVTPASFNASGLYTAHSAYVSAGQRVRVCLAFDSIVSSGPTYGSDALQADLDLYVYNPAGGLIATSTSAIQPFEIVDFTATTSGYYTVRIKKYSMSSASEYWGSAFSVSSDQ